MYELIAGYKTISPLPKVDLNQLLKRQPVVVDKTEIAELLADATVLVTGAGGSIGRELCRQIAQLKPAQLVLLGHGENSIFEIGMELRLAFPGLSIHQIIADVRDAKHINQVIGQFRPKVIYHAAAHKHVPLMQSNVEEVITNNVQGTLNVLRAAEQYGVPNFVLISTDKAINPTSMMGASKRIAELLVAAAAKRSGLAYKAVRFGNVLGSRGSVLPIFQRQIAAGGPITITHPEMTRYFMTIPEAVQLVLQATVLGHSGEIFVLDMGKPVRILNLVEGLLQMSGLKLGDIEIVSSGIRPGEKLYEELFQATEHHERTKCEKIFVAIEKGIIADENIEDAVMDLIDVAQQRDTSEVIRQVKQLLPTYQPGPVHQEVGMIHKVEALNGYSMQQELMPVSAG
jgi:FlaA1/EpsC-like NDP-sugar epimerase